MIYIVVFVLFLIGVILFDSPNSQKRNKGRFYYWACYFILCLLFGLRYRVGGDTLNYMVYYEYIPRLSEMSLTDLLIFRLEPGFAALMAFFKQYTNAFYGVQIVESAFVNYVWFWCINKYVNRRFLAISLYYVMFSFYFNTEIMREAIAVGLFVIAYNQLLQHRLLRYYFIVSIGLFFHLSCLFMFIVPPLKWFLSNEQRLWMTVVLAVLFTYLAPYLFQYAGGMLLEKIEHQKDYSFTIFGVLGSAIKTVLFPWFISNLYRKYVDNNQRSEWNRLLYIYIVFGSLALGNFSILMRLTNYLQPFFLVIISLVLQRIAIGIGKQPVLVVIVCFFICFANIRPYFEDKSEITSGAKYYNLWYPYHSIFDDEEDVMRERFVRDQFDAIGNR